MANLSKYRKIKIAWDESDANKALKSGWDLIAVVPEVYNEDSMYEENNSRVIKTNVKFVMGKTKMGQVLHD